MARVELVKIQPVDMCVWGGGKTQKNDCKEKKERKELSWEVKKFQLLVIIWLEFGMSGKKVREREREREVIFRRNSF